MGRVWVVEKPDPNSRVRLYEQTDATYVQGWGREERVWHRQQKMNGRRHEYSMDKMDRDGSMYLSFVMLLRVLDSTSLAYEFKDALRWKKVLFNFQTGFSFSEREIQHWIDQEVAGRRTFGAHKLAFE